jgi:hypothetical protein
MNNRKKSLEQLRDFVKLINEEMRFLEQKEEVEVTRDWSSPSKLNSSQLKKYKTVSAFLMKSNLLCLLDLSFK